MITQINVDIFSVICIRWAACCNIPWAKMDFEFFLCLVSTIRIRACVMSYIKRPNGFAEIEYTNY